MLFVSVLLVRSLGHGAGDERSWRIFCHETRVLRTSLNQPFPAARYSVQHKHQFGKKTLEARNAFTRSVSRPEHFNTPRRRETGEPLSLRKYPSGKVGRHFRSVINRWAVTSNINVNYGQVLRAKYSISEGLTSDGDISGRVKVNLSTQVVR